MTKNEFNVNMKIERRLMKKIFLTILLALTLTGCNKTNLLEESTLNMNNEYLKMEINEEKTTNEGITFKLINISNYDLTYGLSYHLEKEENDKWYKVKPKEEMHFIMVAYNLKKGEEKEENLKWTSYYGKLSKGKYRIVKSFNLENTKEMFYTSQEFIIK